MCVRCIRIGSQVLSGFTLIIVHRLYVCIQYLEHNIYLFSQWVGIDQSQLEGNCVGVEEGTGLHTNTGKIILSALHHTVMLSFRHIPKEPSHVFCSVFFVTFIYPRLFLKALAHHPRKHKLLHHACCVNVDVQAARTLTDNERYVWWTLMWPGVVWITSFKGLKNVKQYQLNYNCLHSIGDMQAAQPQRTSDDSSDIILCVLSPTSPNREFSTCKCSNTAFKVCQSLW